MATREEIIDQWADNYVRSAYKSVFGREPDPGGLDFYKKIAIEQGGGAVTNALVFSQEGQQREQERNYVRQLEQEEAQKKAQERALEKARQRDLELLRQLEQSRKNIADQYGDQAAVPLANAVERLEISYEKKYVSQEPAGVNIPGTISSTAPSRSAQKYNNWAATLQKPLFSSYNDVIKQINSEIEPGFALYGGGWDFGVVPSEVKDRIIGPGAQFTEEFGGTVSNADLKKLFVDETGIDSPDALYAWYVDGWGLRGPVRLNTYDELLIKEKTDPMQDFFGTDKFFIENLEQIKSAYNIDQQTLEVALQLQAADQKLLYQNTLAATNINELLANVAKTSLESKGLLNEETRTNLNNFAQEGEQLAEERRKVIEELSRNKNNGIAFVLSVGAAFFAPYLGPKIGAAIGLTGTAATVVGGGLIGGAVSSATGGDFLKGFVSGAVGSFGSTPYATQVGKTLGFASDATAKIVGNAVINSAMSGLQAAVLGGNIGESMLSGFVTGAIIANPSDIANTLVGGEKNLADLVKNTNISVEQAQQIITSSVANAVVAEIRGQNFANALFDNLVAGGVSISVANKTSSLIDKSLSPEARNAVVTISRGVVDTGTRAILDGQNVSLALENAAPSIITSGAISYQNTKTFLEGNEKLAKLPEETRLLLASVDTGTLSDASNSLDAEVIAEIAKQVTNLRDVEVTAKRTILDDALKLANDVWDRMSGFLGDYAEYQKDNVVRSIIGIANVTQSIYGVAGGGPQGLLAGNIQALDRVKQSLNQLLSAEAIQDRAASLRILKAAEQGGFLDQVISGFEAFAQDPAGYTSEALGSVIPNLVMASVTSGASFMGRLLPQIGLNVASSVGEVKNSIYETVFKEAKKVGLSDVEAAFLGTEAQAYGGKNTDMMALAATISAATALVPGSFEQQIVNRIATKSARDVALRASTAGLIESATEGIQSAQNAVSQNLAINRIPDPREQMIREVGENTEVGRAIREMINQTPWQRALQNGVWGQAVVEALSGGIVSAGASLGLSAADINQWAQETAREQGNWELLDKPVSSEIIVKGFIDPEVIDVFAREVGTQRLTGPDGEVATETETPLLTGPTDQEVIDVTDIAGDQDVTDVTDVAEGEDVTDVTDVPSDVIDGETTVISPETGQTTQTVDLQERVDDILAANLNQLFTDLQDANATALTAFQNFEAAQQEIQTLQESGDLNGLTRTQLQQLEVNLNNLLNLAEQAASEQALIESKINDIAAVQQGETALSDEQLQAIVDTGGLPAPDIEGLDLTADELSLLEGLLQESQPDDGLGGAPDDQGDIAPGEDVGGELGEDVGGELGGDVAVVPEEDVGGDQPTDIPVDEVFEGDPEIETEDGKIVLPDIEIDEPDEDDFFPPVEEDLISETPIDEEDLETVGEDGEDREESTSLRPILIFEDPDDRGAPSISPRVTGEALASILGAKKPLFAGDPEEQRAVWNRRSLRLRKALGL